jgi:hypothetical protein
VVARSDSLIEFRTAYLRAVGLVWRSGEPTPSADVLDLLDSTKNALAALNRLFGCKVPWNIWLRLIWHTDPAKRPQWRPRLSGGWVGGEQHHKIVVHTPDATCLGSVAEAAPALAAYYALSPDLFGRRPDAGEDQGFDVKLGSITSFEEFAGVFIRMLGLLWRAEAEPALNTLPAAFFADPEEEFLRWFAYRWPWDMQLTFIRCSLTAQPGVRYLMRWHVAAPGSVGVWQFAEAATNPVVWKNGLPPNELELNIPHYPMVEGIPGARDSSIEPVALAAYNQSGENHPCTCCAC